MSYVLPDEPQGAIRPGLAVSALWPLLTLMIVGPLAGFVWLAFNSWALGCRRAVRHSAIAAFAIPIIGILALGAVSLADVLADGAWAARAGMIARLALIAVHALALLLAFWIMVDQDGAEQWRRTFGQPLATGWQMFVVLVVVRILAEELIPGPIAIFAFWTAG